MLGLQLSKSLTHWAAVILFFYFGLRSLYDAITEKVRSSPAITAQSCRFAITMATPDLFCTVLTCPAAPS